MKFWISLILLAVAVPSFAIDLGRTRVEIQPPGRAVPTGRFEPSKDSWNKAARLVKKMSVDEKIGQLIHVGVNAKFANQDSQFFQDLKRQVTELKVGGIIFYQGPVYETVHLANRMQEAAKFPLLMSLDAETGIGMRFPDAEIFPWAMALGATGDPELARRMGAIAGREAKVTGFQQIFAPVLDVNNSADNPVINVRSFGEDPETVALFGAAFIQGLQSERVLATAKHFPGHGDTGVDSHRALPIVTRTRKQLDEIELLPFRSAIDAGVGSIMIAHIGLPAIDGERILPLNKPPASPYVDAADTVEGMPGVIPATLSEKVQTGILRREFGFKGLTVSDAMDMSGLTVYFTSEEAGVRALLAGTDILEKPLDPAKMIAGIKAAVLSGRVPMSRLDDAVTRQIAWKYELGIFKNRITPLDQIDRVVSNAETRKLADEIAAKAMTLVRNDAGLLPLDRGSKVAVLGISNGFDGPPTMAAFTTELRSSGLRFTQGYVQENSLPPQMEAARKAVRDADVVVVGLYGRVRTGSANSAKLPENGAALVREALAANKKVIGISFGNPYILSSFPEMRTYLVAYGDMPSLQRAAGRSIMGTQPVTGKLPITLPDLHPRGTGIQLRNANAVVRLEPVGRTVFQP